MLFCFVTVAPQVTVAKPAVHTGPGDDVTVDCVVHASPEATVVWYHNDSVIDRQERTNLNIRTEGEKWILHITDLLPRDLGEYSCVAGNTYGSDSGSNVLTGRASGDPQQICIFVIRGSTHYWPTANTRHRSNVGPTLIRHWMDVLSLLGYYKAAPQRLHLLLWPGYSNWSTESRVDYMAGIPAKVCRVR